MIFCLKACIFQEKSLPLGREFSEYEQVYISMSKINDYTALGPLVGFVYQIYYFLYCLLTIKDGDTVSLEKIDDVGVESGEKQTYYQLKHSICSKPSMVKRMADRDTNLWKTLNMWVNIIKKQGNESAQKLWIENSDFVLISNMTTDNNKFFELVKAYKEDDGKWEDLEKYISDQAAKEPKEQKIENGGEEKKNIYVYTKNVNDYALKKELLKHVSVEFESDDELTIKIDHEIQYKKHIPEKRVTDMRIMLIGGITDSVVKEETSFTMEGFDAAYGTLINDVRTRKFVPLNRAVVLPDRPMEQTFVKQLQDVDAPRCNDMKEIIQLTEQKLRFENDYRASNNAAGAHVQRQFESDMHTEWKNVFDSKNRKVNFMSGEEKIREAGWQVLNEVKGIHLKYAQEDIGPAESNGCFYHFSDGDQPQIGWRVDWETLYNGKEWTTD